jgi:hypothetical protein
LAITLALKNVSTKRSQFDIAALPLSAAGSG